MLRQPGSVPKSVLKSLTSSTVAFIGYSIILGVMVSAIDNAAHAGGLAGGFALAWVLARPLGPRPALPVARMAGGALLAGASIAALFALLPAPKYSYAAQKAATAAIQAFAVEEEALAKQAQALVDDRRVGRITDRQLGEAIELQLLPGWNAAYARFVAMRLEPEAPAARKVGELTDFVRVRRDMFAEYAAGLKTGDAARMRRAEELSAEAQRMMKAMQERGK